MTKFKLFDYWYFFSVVPFLNFNAFGFWRVWYYKFDLYKKHGYQQSFQLGDKEKE